MPSSKFKKLADSSDNSGQEKIRQSLAQTAIRFLSYKSRFREEISKRLENEIKKKNYPSTSSRLISPILDKLEKNHLLNDEELVKDYINYYLKEKLKGPYFIKQILILKNAPSDLIEENLTKLATPEAQGEAINTFLQKKLVKTKVVDRKEREKLIRQLKSRGFDFHLILKKIDECVQIG